MKPTRKFKLRHSVLLRLLLGYALCVAVSIGFAAFVFYANTAGLLSRDVDKQLVVQSRRLAEIGEASGRDGLVREIHALLTDDKDVEIEVYLLLDANGRKLIGNLTAWPQFAGANSTILERSVQRVGKASRSRLLPRRLSNGDLLVVGRDMHDLRELGGVIRDAVAAGVIGALLLAMFGAALFRWQLRRTLSAIHRATMEVGAGNLRRRIDIGDSHDEFALISQDINRMLDDIERLMDVARAVSNSIAHDLRTPLSRIRSSLDNALQRDAPLDVMRESARRAMADIDGLTTLFDKLLAITEAESGVRRQSFVPLALAQLAGDIADLYESAMEASGQSLELVVESSPIVLGDRDLIANMLGNLLDNAIKYAGSGARVVVRIGADGDHARLTVEDDGVGMAQGDIEQAARRFFRGDESRSQPGNGLGLAIVAALVALHDGVLRIEDAAPGLRVLIDLPLSVRRQPA